MRIRDETNLRPSLETQLKMQNDVNGRMNEITMMKNQSSSQEEGRRTDPATGALVGAVQIGHYSAEITLRQEDVEGKTVPSSTLQADPEPRPSHQGRVSQTGHTCLQGTARSLKANVLASMSTANVAYMLRKEMRKIYLTCQARIYQHPSQGHEPGHGWDPAAGLSNSIIQAENDANDDDDPWCQHVLPCQPAGRT